MFNQANCTENKDYTQLIFGLHNVQEPMVVDNVLFKCTKFYQISSIYHIYVHSFSTFTRIVQT